MDKTKFAEVLCRFLALYFVLSAVSGVAKTIMTLGTTMLCGGLSMFTAQLILNMAWPDLVYLLVGLVVWRMAPSIGKRMAE